MSSFGAKLPLLLVILFCAFMYMSGRMTQFGNQDSKFARDFAATYPKLAYQAMFDQISPKGNGRVVYSCDGKGHVRIKEHASVIQYNHEPQNENSPKFFQDVDRITLIDYLEGKRFVVLPHDSTYQESKLSNLGVDIYDEGLYKASGAKSLGTQNMDGVTVHGWVTTFPLTDEEQTEAWFDANGVLYFAKSNGASTKRTRFQTGTLGEQYFTLPPGYKKTKF